MISIGGLLLCLLVETEFLESRREEENNNKINDHNIYTS